MLLIVLEISVNFHLVLTIYSGMHEAFSVVNKIEVWLTSSTFLTKISFCFNEKLSRHPLTK